VLALDLRLIEEALVAEIGAVDDLDAVRAADMILLSMNATST